MAEIKGNIFTFAGVTDVHDCKTSREVMIKSGLNWNVAKAQVYAKMPGQTDYDNPSYGMDSQFFNGADSFKPVDNNFAVYRTDKNIPLGMVNSRYEPVQNVDAFKFFDDVIGPNDVSWFTAGCSGLGNKVFVSAKLSDNVLVNGKDPINMFLVFSTSHDGSKGVRIMLTPIRLVCFNAMNAAIRNADSFITIRHTKTVHRKITQAQEILGITRKKIDLFAQMMEQMTKVKFTEQDAFDIFGRTLLSKTEMAELINKDYTINDLARRNWNAMDDCHISSQKVNQLCEMINYYHTGPGQQEYLGTGYGVYNAVNGFYSNCQNDEGYKRMEKLVDGTHAEKIKLASDLILN